MSEVLPLGLSVDHLQIICDFVYRRTGMSYGEAKRYYIERRVADGMDRAGLRSFPAYIKLLQADPAQAQRFINSFTVNETYFYREDYQLRCLGRDLLPAIVSHRRPGDLVRIWSVPCATGEEPYSLAIWLLENWPMVDAYHIDIVGSDIDTRALREAVDGEYGERALARLPADVAERYFEPAHGGVRRIIQDLRESVHFTPVNLIDASSMRAQGQFDIVFCRNVLIYFDSASRIAAIENLYRAINPGGFICLGHAESMSRISERFETRRFDDAIVYQRPHV
jgi:chemotaxis protein methyltransferase CheR